MVYCTSIKVKNVIIILYFVSIIAYKLIVNWTIIEKEMRDIGEMVDSAKMFAEYFGTGTLYYYN